MIYIRHLLYNSRAESVIPAAEFRITSSSIWMYIFPEMPRIELRDLYIQGKCHTTGFYALSQVFGCAFYQMTTFSTYILNNSFSFLFLLLLLFTNTE